MGVGDRVWQVGTVGRRGGGKEGVTGGGGRQGVAGGISFIRHPCLLFAVIEQI